METFWRTTVMSVKNTKLMRLRSLGGQTRRDVKHDTIKVSSLVTANQIHTGIRQSPLVYREQESLTVDLKSSSSSASSNTILTKPSSSRTTTELPGELNIESIPGESSQSQNDLHRLLQTQQTIIDTLQLRLQKLETMFHAVCQVEHGLYFAV